MRRAHSMKHLEVSAGILIYQGKILCLQRGKGKYSYTDYTYEFPGGKIEPGESKEEALVREIGEELDISLDNYTFYDQISYTYPDFSVTLYFFLCHLQSPEFTRKEHINHQWLQPDQLKTLTWAAADAALISRLEKEHIGISTSGA